MRICILIVLLFSLSLIPVEAQYLASQSQAFLAAQKSFDGSGAFKTIGAHYTVKREVITGDLKYEGFAVPGTATSAASWLIRRYTWTDGFPDVEYANGESKFDQIWDNRDSLSYS